MYVVGTPIRAGQKIAWVKVHLVTPQALYLKHDASIFLKTENPLIELKFNNVMDKQQ